MFETSLLRFYRAVSQIFNLRQDSDEAGTIENIRKNVDFQGANAWTLVFAIFIASVGLNMNSAAVIIGAMLVSPLMGPILGIGLALGINDEPLLRKSLRNLGVAVLISMVTSMIYFLLSPFQEAQSELLARTYPTFYDVLIAFFGGAAGIVSISRKERGPSVAGVAIATALMPPLCTAGFALATFNIQFFAGALYLFLINSVFIALSTFFFVRYMKFHVVQPQEKDDRLKLRRWIGVIVVAMILPSLFFAWSLLQESKFKLKAERFIKEELHSKNVIVVGKSLHFSYRSPVIEISLVGMPLSQQAIDDITQRLPLYGVSKAKLEIKQFRPDESPSHLESSPAEIELAQLKQRQFNLEEKLKAIAKKTEELHVLFPGVKQVIPLGEGVAVVWKSRPSKEHVAKINSLLALQEWSGPAVAPIHLFEFASR